MDLLSKIIAGYYGKILYWLVFLYFIRKDSLAAFNSLNIKPGGRRQAEELKNKTTNIIDDHLLSLHSLLDFICCRLTFVFLYYVTSFFP